MKNKLLDILFLDIDGVLNNWIYDGSGAYQPKDAAIKAGWKFYETPISEYNLNNLKFILNKVPELKIVWCTTWRVMNKPIYGKWNNPLKYLMSNDWIESRVIGNTPKKFSSSKSEEIMMYLSENKKIINDYYILDDDVTYGFPNHRSNISESYGLTEDISKEVINHFNIKS